MCRVARGRYWNVRSTSSRMGSCVAALLTAPLVAEFLLGDVTLASLPAAVLSIPLSGGCAVMINEVVRREVVRRRVGACRRLSYSLWLSAW